MVRGMATNRLSHGTTSTKTKIELDHLHTPSVPRSEHISSRFMLLLLLLLLLLFASICYFLITRLKLLNIFYMFVFLFCMFVVYFVYSVFVMLCVLFLLLYIPVSSLFVYKFTDHCHRVETQLQ
jgi:hypothetical protein